MLKRKVFLLIFACFLIIPVVPANAESDELGYQYTVKKAEEIDFEDGNFFISLLSGDPSSKDALYAVYDNSQLEKYEREEFRNSNAMTTFSTVTAAAALPTKFSDFYSGSKWRTRSDGVTLSVYPKGNAWKKSPNAVVQAHLEKKRWEVVYNKHKNDKNWNHTASMKAQLQCHAETVRGTKNPWNIEPWRTTSNYAKVLAKACNPPKGY
ncbi:DUF2599 domain-containing protein [Priestia megaterium]|uniref:DUF2599 domain-containing protein n=1 Tax=Priestia megaterium TaxID=1404 RepID=UPI002E20F353|nr:DUF2599 domain-containing protein [Priestia megaterium]